MAEEENQLKKGKKSQSSGTGRSQSTARNVDGANSVSNASRPPAKKRKRHHKRKANDSVDAKPEKVLSAKADSIGSVREGEQKKKRKRKRHKKKANAESNLAPVVEPVQQVEPVQPEVSPFDATWQQPEAVQPSESVQPTEPIQQVEPTQPDVSPFDTTWQQSEPVQPSESVQQVEPTQPEVSPFDTTWQQPEAVQPSEPVQPVESAQPEVSPFDQAPVSDFGVPAVEPTQPEVSPFDTTWQQSEAVQPSEPIQQVEPAQPEVSPFDTTWQQPEAVQSSEPVEPTEPIQQVEPAQPEVSPFDQAPAPDFGAPAVEPAQPAASPFDQAPAPDFGSPATEPAQPEVSPFDTTWQQPEAVQPSELVQPVEPALTGDPMKDISIFPDNFGDDQSTDSMSEVAEPAQPLNEDPFSQVVPKEESPFDLPPSVTPEPIEAEVVSTSSSVVPESADKDAAGFALPGEKPQGAKTLFESLAETGISKRFIFGTCSSIIVLIVIVVFFSIGGLSAVTDMFKGIDLWPFNNEQSTNSNSSNSNNKENQNSNSTNNTSINNAVIFGKNAGNKFLVTLPSPLRTGQLFGKEFRPLDVSYWKSALTNAAVIGLPTIKDKLEGDYRIVTAIDLLKRMSNAYKVDINDALNRAVSREQSLDDYLAVMNKLYDDAKQTKASLEQELSLITTSFNALAQPKKDLETLFFQNMEQLIATDTARNLSDYIRYSQEVVALKARYKALQRIDERFITFLQSFRARIQDLEENRTALIKGVKVYDVPQSDLNLIVPVDLKELE